MPEFYTLITDSGLTSLGLATQENKFSLPQAVVGDGNGTLVTPHKGMTSLVNEVWRGNVSGVHSVESDPNTLIFEFVIKADIGGFIIREVGLLDDNGDLFCVGNFPETEKPVITDGSVRDLIIRLPLHFENAKTVNLVVDANVVVATKQDVLDHNADPQAHDIMKSDAVDLDSSISVATSKAVKTLTDLFSQHAGSVYTHGDASPTTWGFVRLATETEHIECTEKNAAVTPWGMWEFIKHVLNDSVTDPSSERLATSNAVKTVNDALTAHQNEDGPHFSGIHGGIEMFDGAVNSDGRPIDAKTGLPNFNYGVCDGRTYTAPDGRQVATPNCTDRFVVAAGGNYGTWQIGGLNTVTLTTEEMPSHNHLLRDDKGYEYLALNDDNVGDARGSDAVYYEGPTEKNMGDSGIDHTLAGGGSQPHENRPPYIGLFLIKRL